MSDREQQEKEQDLKLVNQALNTLGEHFDSVHIFVTRHLGQDGTANINKGVGNWFARAGQIRDWCIRADESTRFDMRKDLSE